MTEHDFDTFDIRFFTAKEVRATGAHLVDVRAELITTLEQFRRKIGCAVMLIHGGMTTGKHRSPYHKKGKAADFVLAEPRDAEVVIACAYRAGATGIGIYHNDKTYSYHIDVGDTYRSWSGYKHVKQDEWAYAPLINDPARLLV
jgi:hypothetical protein